MTDLVPTAGGPPAPRPTFSEAKAAKVRETLKRIRATHLALFAQWTTLQGEQRQAARELLAQGLSMPNFLAPQVRVPDQPATEEDREQELRYLAAADRCQPDRLALIAHRDKAAEARSAKYNPAQTRIIVGLMVNSFPNARPHSPESYLEAVIDQLEAAGLSPTAAAQGCEAVKVSSHFLPSIAEVVEACRKADAELGNMVAAIETYLSGLVWVAAATAWVRDVPLLAQDRSNRTFFREPPRRLMTGAGRIL